MQVTRTSMISGKTRTLDLNITQYQIMAYNAGMLIQDAFPNLSATEREFLMTGITAEEWDATFGNEEEDDG